MVFCEVCRIKIKKGKEIEAKIDNKVRYLCDKECLQIYREEKLMISEKEKK
jgi:hypothetical protein